MLGVTLQCTSISSRGSRISPSCVMLLSNQRWAVAWWTTWVVWGGVQIKKGHLLEGGHYLLIEWLVALKFQIGFLCLSDLQFKLTSSIFNFRQPLCHYFFLKAQSLMSKAPKAASRAFLPIVSRQSVLGFDNYSVYFVLWKPIALICHLLYKV